MSAKEIVQLLYNQGIERVHDACECQGQEGEGSGRRAVEGSGVLVAMLPQVNLLW